ncbi:MAG: 3-oxoacyl-[acyl-carrier protein] reductase [Gammaproteobacteria bacterium]|jgi:3-oxoacyl-[acyl-carrier protein] reductase
MDSGLSGRTVLITGAARNIGRETALMCAQEGANLALCTRGNLDGLNHTATAARELGAKVVTAQCDVADGDMVKAFVKAANDEFGRIDVAINNAVYRAEGDFLSQSFEQWSRNIDVNLNGPFHVCQAVLPLMIEAGFGRIINYSGIAPFVGHGPAKGVVKLGIVGFTRGLARAYGQHGITANCIGPGVIDVERDAWQMEKGAFPDQPVPRMGTPREIASLALYLASENAAFITGQCYLANGGQHFL